jgi:predicted nucleic acid-binding protein
MILKTPIIFDNDCISSFLWINRTDIINTLFDRQIIIPASVYDEIKKLKRFSNYNYVYYNLETEISNGSFQVEDIGITSPLLNDYMALTSMTNPKRIGKGEAAAIIIARAFDGTLASNNLKDVLPHIKNGQPPLICTEHILFMYYDKNYISPDDGQKMWQEMKSKRRMLPDYDFYTVINKFSK